MGGSSKCNKQLNRGRMGESCTIQNSGAGNTSNDNNCKTSSFGGLQLRTASVRTSADVLHFAGGSTVDSPTFPEPGPGSGLARLWSLLLFYIDSYKLLDRSGANIACWIIQSASSEIVKAVHPAAHSPMDPMGMHHTKFVLLLGLVFCGESLPLATHLPRPGIIPH